MSHAVDDVASEADGEGVELRVERVPAFDMPVTVTPAFVALTEPIHNSAATAW